MAKLSSKQSTLGGGKFAGGTKICLASAADTGGSVSGILWFVIRLLFLTPCNDNEANNQTSRSSAHRF